MPSTKREQFLMPGVALVCALAVLPALAEESRHLLPHNNIPAATTTCNAASACAAYNNAGTGPGLVSNSAGGTGFVSSTSSTSGNGLEGIVNATTGYTSGVSGRSSKSNDSNGVTGDAYGGTGIYGAATTGIGVYGASTGPTGGGVFGNSSNASGIGVDGGNSSSGGVAVQGVATGNGAKATGVLGYLSSASPTGFAVAGYVGSSANSTATSVVGIAFAPNGGAGLLGLGTGEGVQAIGAAAQGDSAHPALSVISAAGADSAGVFNSDSSKAIETLEIKSTTANKTLCTAAKAKPPCPAGGDVYITGDVHVKGALYTTKGGTAPYDVPRSFGGGTVTYFGTAARSARLEEDGEAQLQEGQTYVRLDPDFASTIDPRRPYLVFVTPEGDRAMYVSARAPTGFLVREVGGGRSTVPFAYRIVANAVPMRATESDGFPVVRDAIVNPKRALEGSEVTAQRDAALSAKLANRPRRM